MFPNFFSLRQRTVGAAVLTGMLALFADGCVSVRTIPYIARPNDTVSLMIGGSEAARKDTTDVTLVSEVNGHQEWDLQLDGKVRSVFNLRADGTAVGMHYSDYSDLYVSWLKGHEPLQTVLVVDLPPDVPVGPAQMVVDIHASDDTSGIPKPVTIDLDIINEPGGLAEDFAHKLLGGGTAPAEFDRLEPAPYAKISFGNGSAKIGAASLVVDFDPNVVDPNDINVYVPEATVRGSFTQVGSFGDKQRMVYWHQDGQKLYLDILAPQGIQQTYLMAYLIQPPGIGDAGFFIESATLYDVNGGEISISGQPSLVYSP